MIKVISKKGALKVFYYLMALDGVSSFEQDRFEEIGSELLGEEFSGIKEEIVSECESVIDSIEEDDERYDVIQEGLDNALNESVETIESGVVPRLLVWDLLTLAHSDSDYSDEENRLINHIVRVLRIDKSVLAEMKQLISTARSILDEKNTLENSTRPYREIRPLMDEVEKRQLIIVEAAKTLIADDYVLEKPEKEEEDNFLITAGKNIGDFVVDSGKKIGESVTPIMKSVGDFAVSGASGIADGAGKLFSRLFGSAKSDDESE